MSKFMSSTSVAVATFSSVAAIAGVLWWRSAKNAHVQHRALLGVRVVCISDTHGCEAGLTLPDGDILIHAGDFTHFGKETDARRFNDWLGTLPHKIKVVVNGNHENNADWKKNTPKILSNAIFLRQEPATVTVPTSGGDKSVHLFGTEFFWPCKGRNPYYDQIPEGTDIIVAHGPAKGLVDGGSGCSALLARVRELQPRAVISGHVHRAHGVISSQGVIFVNAAICGEGTYRVGHEAVVIDL